MRDDARDDRFAPYSAADLTMNLVPIAGVTLVMIVLRVQFAFERAEQSALATFVKKPARLCIDTVRRRWPMNQTT